LTFNEYRDGTVRRTRTRKITIDPKYFPLINAYSGLAGEVGELIDVIKKEIFHGVPADREKVKKELGDALYYLTWVADWFEFDLFDAEKDVAQVNADKLAARYPNGFVQGGGIRTGDGR